MASRNFFKREPAPQNDAHVKVGVVIVRECEAFAKENLQPFIQRLMDLGCSAQQIYVREVSKLHDSIIMIQYMAHYTDADSIIILAPEERVLNTPALMDGIVQQQLQWNMYVTMGGKERADDMQYMFATMREMEAAAPIYDVEEGDNLDISFS